MAGSDGGFAEAEAAEALAHEPPRAGILLAGGRSTRMGRDKALLELNGEPLWQRGLRLLDAAGAQLLMLSCRGGQGLREPAFTWSKARGVQIEVVLDPPAPAQAPESPATLLARVLDGVRGSAWVVPVDVPLLSPAVLAALGQAHSRSGRAVAAEAGGFSEPLIAVYTPGMRARLAQAAAMPGRQPSLREIWRQAVEAGEAEFFTVPPDLAPGLANWNLPEDIPPG
jgi:molybdopterin-guanine dinucleotide biosynthesis protein A